jgi:SAM-dependent methyltransferase
LFSDIIDRLCTCKAWEVPHIIRYKLTYGYLLSHGLLNEGVDILDVGGPSPFRAALKECGHAVDDTGVSDLRYAFACNNWREDRYGLILALEVFEHLADRETDDLTERAKFNASGQLSFLAECKKLLKPDGKLVITTPNAAGWCAIARILNGEPPRMYDEHVREVAQHEMHWLIDQAGLKCVHNEGWDCWPKLPGNDKRWRQKMLATCVEPGVIRDNDIVYQIALP